MCVIKIIINENKLTIILIIFYINIITIYNLLNNFLQKGAPLPILKIE